MQNNNVNQVFNRYKHLLWLLLIVGEALFFLFTKNLNLNYHLIHHKLDDIIPFAPIFSVPYYIWYFYVPGLLLIMGLTNKKGFYFQLIPIYIGIIVSCTLFLIYPSAVDFRPTVTQATNPFLWLCKQLFEFDRPINVFPSLHCFEAACLHLTSFTLGPWKKKKVLRILSAITSILICMSTVFIKQHSIIDLVAGVIMAIVLTTATYLICKKKGCLIN